MEEFSAHKTGWGWKDENPLFYHQYLLPAITPFLSKSSSGAILDVGCGNGFFANTLLDHGYDTYGIDADLEAIDLANRKHPGHFFVNDINNSCLPTELQQLQIKTIISMEVIEHLYSPRTFVAFMRQILEQNGGGTLILTTPYHGYLKNCFISLVGKWDYHWSSLWEGGHIKFWSEHTISILLQEAGFRNVQFRCVGRFPYLWRHMVCRAEI
ncbi:MAG: class I SAM-dependent methyltransferase [Alistipes sp.]